MKLRVCGVLKQWLERHCSDLVPDEEGRGGNFVERLDAFLDTVKLEHPTSATQLKKLVERKGTLRSTTISVRYAVSHAVE